MGKRSMNVFHQLRPAAVLLLVMILLTGIAYPLAMTGIAGVLFPDQAQGSLIEQERHVIGSELIGQQFADPAYFWGRPSATEPNPYNAAASSGSNLGPTSPELLHQVQARIDALHAADPHNSAPIPVDLVTASGSGLDPHISPAAAAYQIPRVARMRGVEEAVIHQLVEEYTEGRQFGFMGESRVNVLLLNLALDEVMSLTEEE
jgi:K+-transporting ATPase ATPase C chain